LIVSSPSDGAEEVAVHFGRNLVRLRRRVDLSQEQLAIRASLHRTEIGLLERGPRLARVGTVVKMGGRPRNRRRRSLRRPRLVVGPRWRPRQLCPREHGQVEG
jgi:DNA-binding XRE family transcriptional regulator